MPQSSPARETAVEASDRARDPLGVEGTEVALRGIGASPQLFRSEVLAERQTQWLGAVLLAPRPWDHVVTAFAVLATAAILGLLFFGEFTRTAKINGWLVPQEGLVRVFAPQLGVVTGLYVKEGAEVHKGERLLALSAELRDSGGNRAAPRRAAPEPVRGTAPAGAPARAATEGAQRSPRGAQVGAGADRSRNCPPEIPRRHRRAHGGAVQGLA